jgi:hypothetical protein
MADFEMPHSGHERHLCFLHNISMVSKLEEYKKLVKDGKYVCKGCGRVAVDENASAPGKIINCPRKPPPSPFPAETVLIRVHPRPIRFFVFR